MMTTAPASAGNALEQALVGPLQIKVMQHVWQFGDSTVYDVAAAVNAAREAKGERALAYTTFLTVMRNLVHRKLLAQRSIPGRRRHRFTATISKRVFRARAARAIVETLFDGDLSEFTSAAADDGAS